MAFKLVTKKLNFSVLGVEPLPAVPAVPELVPALLEPPPELVPALLPEPPVVEPLPLPALLELPELPPAELVPAVLEPLPPLVLPLWPAEPVAGSVGELLPHAASTGATAQIKDALSKSLNIEDTSGVRAMADDTIVVVGRA